jgi:hypothetical protein
MEILIGLVVATLAVLGWFYGSTFACVFLSIPTALFILLCCSADGPSAKQWALGGLLFLIVIWLPRIVRRAAN